MFALLLNIVLFPMLLALAGPLQVIVDTSIGFFEAVKLIESIPEFAALFGSVSLILTSTIKTIFGKNVDGWARHIAAVFNAGLVLLAVFGINVSLFAEGAGILATILDLSVVFLLSNVVTYLEYLGVKGLPWLGKSNADAQVAPVVAG